jgi:hypothetical protein
MTQPGGSADTELVEAAGTMRAKAQESSGIRDPG